MLTNHSNGPERLCVAPSSESGSQERSPVHRKSWGGNGAASHLGQGTAGTWQGQNEERAVVKRETEKKAGEGWGENKEEPEQSSNLGSSLTLRLALTPRAYLPFLFTEAPSLTSDGPSLPLSP